MTLRPIGPETPLTAMPRLPRKIPAGSRVVVRTFDGTSPASGRTQYRDYVGHVISWNGDTLEMLRDESANGRRAAQIVSLAACDIVRLKPVPERPSRR